MTQQKEKSIGTYLGEVIIKLRELKALKKDFANYKRQDWLTEEQREEETRKLNKK